MHEGDHNILEEEHDHHPHHHAHEADAGHTRQARSRIIAGVVVGAAVVMFLLWRMI